MNKIETIAVGLVVSSIAVEKILQEIGIEKSTFQKDISYRHWQRFIEFLLQNDGENWDKVRNRMRSYVGIDHRYLNDFMNCLISWEIVTLENGKIKILWGINN